MVSFLFILVGVRPVLLFDAEYEKNKTIYNTIRKDKRKKIIIMMVTKNKRKTGKENYPNVNDKKKKWEEKRMQ